MQFYITISTAKALQRPKNGKLAKKIQNSFFCSDSAKQQQCF
jgi:hypothetical protein